MRTPGVGGSLRRRLRRLWHRYDAELLEEAEGVPHFPGLRNLAVSHPMDRDGLDTDRLAGRRDTVHVAYVRPAPDPAHHDSVAGGEQLLDLPMPAHRVLIRGNCLYH